MAGTLIGLFLFIALEWVPWMIQDRVWPDNSQGSKELTFWLETASGNWSPSDPPVSHRAYAFSAVVAVLLNNAMVVAVITLFWRLTTLWRREMRLNQAFTARDQMNKQALYRRLDALLSSTNEDELRQEIERSFEEGRGQWREHIRSVFGPEEAERLFTALERLSF